MKRRGGALGRWILIVVVAGGVHAGCSPSNDGQSSALPPPGKENIARELESIPLPPRTVPYGPAQRSGTMTAQSFQVTGFSQRSLIDFFAQRLPGEGWSPSDPAHREAAAGRADFVRSDERLEVSAIAVDAERGVGSQQAVVQFSLILRPA